MREIMMSDNDEKYDLYTEKINQTPAVKYRRVIRFAKYVLMTAVLAVVAGLCFGLAFRLTTGRTEDVEDKRIEVSIPQDEIETGEAPTVYQTEEASGEETTQPASQESSEPLPFYQTQYQELSPLLDTIKRSIASVRTTSYKGDDYLASIWQEDYGNALLLAENGVEYLLLTQYDVCRNADDIFVVLNGGQEIQARLLVGNTVTNTAVIAVDMSAVTNESREHIELASVGNSYLVKQGQPVVALGTLYGLKDSMEYGMAVNTSNIIYDADGRFGMIYTNIASNGGNSGFLFNAAGEAIGVITDNYESNGNVMAYGISDLKKIMENMSNQKEVAYLGVIGYDISEEDATDNGIPIGAYVTRTEAESPAFYAGIRSGDIITKLDGRTILNMYNVSTALCEYEPNTKVDILVYRKGKEGYVPIEFSVTLSVK
jgi:S1-C subfamily serine protease